MRVTTEERPVDTRTTRRLLTVVLAALDIDIELMILTPTTRIANGHSQVCEAPTDAGMIQDLEESEPTRIRTLKWFCLRRLSRHCFPTWTRPQMLEIATKLQPPLITAK
jgi:hypothetical protein